MTDENNRGARLTLTELFAIFLKAGCGFGGGLGVLGLLEEQLVTLRRILSAKELLTLWSIGRVMPSGTMTAVAVAVGHRLAGLPGTVVALIAMILPGFVSVILLTIAYSLFAHGPVLDYINATLLPAALGIIVVSSVRLARGLRFLSLEPWIALVVCILALAFNFNPAILLVAGGIVGAMFLRDRDEAAP